MIDPVGVVLVLLLCALYFATDPKRRSEGRIKKVEWKYDEKGWARPSSLNQLGQAFLGVVIGIAALLLGILVGFAICFLSK